MRTIEFRGKRIDNNEWVYGLLTQYKGKLIITKEIIEHPSMHDPSGTWIYEEDEVNPETVGQFTGLLDKDGNKIFEGDVVQDVLTSLVMKIKFGHCLKRGYNGWYCSSLFGTHSINGDYDTDQNSSITIIGNIHDNPDF